MCWVPSTYFRCLQGSQESCTLSLRRFGGGRGRCALSAMVPESGPFVRSQTPSQSLQEENEDVWRCNLRDHGDSNNIIRSDHHSNGPLRWMMDRHLAPAASTTERQTPISVVHFSPLTATGASGFGQIDRRPRILRAPPLLTRSLVRRRIYGPFYGFSCWRNQPLLQRAIAMTSLRGALYPGIVRPPILSSTI